MADHQSASHNENSSVTITLEDDDVDSELQHQDIATVRLKLRKPKSSKKVNWTEETVDNEHLDKKKSKCCCVYQKPRAQDESSSSDEDDECDHCQGHVERKKKKSKDSSSHATKEPITPSMVVA